MAGIGHIAIGMAAARIHGAGRVPRGRWVWAAVLWPLLSMLPDADVIGFSVGVQYEDEWGHRGATHSFVFSAALGAAIALVAPLLRLPRVRTGVLATLVLASHALLDTLTNGGLGCALLWPFDLTRYFAPWNPIPVSPIGLNLLSRYGLVVAVVEVFLFAPLLWFAWRPAPAPQAAIRPSRATGLLMSAWLAGGWLLTSGDPVRETVVRQLVRDNTVFAPRFTEAGLDAVQEGEAEHAVLERLGPPLLEFAGYVDGPDRCVAMQLEADVVTSARPPDICRRHGVERGVTRAALVQALGPPAQSCWVYSQSPSGGFFRARAVCFVDARVDEVIRRWARE